jgi:hypothetical protein
MTFEDAVHAVAPSPGGTSALAGGHSICRRNKELRRDHKSNDANSGDPAIRPRPRGYNFQDLAFDLQDVAGTGGPWPGELASGAYDAAG